MGDLTFHRNTADDFVARHKPGGAEQDISADLIEAVFAADRDSGALLTLTSNDSNEIEKLAAVSQGSTAVTSFLSSGGGGIIEAAGATFVDAKVLPGEEVVVTTDQAGTYTVGSVISNTKLRVLEPLVTAAAPTATVVVNRGDGWFRVKLDDADMDLLTPERGLVVLYRTIGGAGGRRFLRELCFEMLSVPS